MKYSIFTCNEGRPEVWGDSGRVSIYGEVGQQPKIGDTIPSIGEIVSIDSTAGSKGENAGKSNCVWFNVTILEKANFTRDFGHKGGLPAHHNVLPQEDVVKRDIGPYGVGTLIVTLKEGDSETNIWTTKSGFKFKYNHTFGKNGGASIIPL